MRAGAGWRVRCCRLRRRQHVRRLVAIAVRRSATGSASCSARSRTAVGEAPPPPVDNRIDLSRRSASAPARRPMRWALPGKPAVGNDLRYQATITRTARDCTQNGGQITARIGIQGRVIAGPAGARRRSKFRCASRWCRAASRRRRSPPRSTAPRCRWRRPATCRSAWWPRIWCIRCRPARPAIPTSSISASIRRR